MKNRKLVEYRRKKLLTSKQMAENIGISRAAYSLLENGHNQASIKLMQKIRDEHGEDVLELFR